MKGDILSFEPSSPTENPLQSFEEGFIVPFGDIMRVEIPEGYINQPPACAKVNTAMPDPDSQESDNEKK